MKRRISNIIRYKLYSIADLVMNTNVVYYFKQIRIMENWNNDEITKWQNHNLQNFIHYAYSNTEYYKELFDNNKLKLTDIKNINDLKKVPIITRELVIKNTDKLIPKDIKDIPHKKASTGGTSSEPMTYLLDKRSWSFTNAQYMSNWERTKYNFGDKFIALGSTSIFSRKPNSIKHKMYYLLKNKISLNGMRMTDEICDKYIKLIKKRKIKYIYGYASSIFLLAKYVSKNNIKINILACFTTAEVLTDLYRETIKTSFNSKIINCYGANDGGITAFEHERNSFEVGYDTLVRIDSKNQTSPNTGPILTTNILNFAMPLINYKLGDVVKLKNEKNKYNGQVLEKVIGRTSDIISLENGAVLTSIGFYTNLFKDVPVIAYKLRKGETNELICEIKRKPNFNNLHKEKIKFNLQKYAGVDSIITIVNVDKFENTKSGKKNHIITG